MHAHPSRRSVLAGLAGLSAATALPAAAQTTAPGIGAPGIGAPGIGAPGIGAPVVPPNPAAPVPSSISGRLRHLAYSDIGGHPDSVQAMHSGHHLFVGHMFANGFSVLDVADPLKPTPVTFVAAPPNTRTHHLQTAGDLMLVVCGADIPTIGKYDSKVSYYEQSFADGMKGKANFAAGLKIYDISKPATPREIGFLEIPGIGLNRLWWTGGRIAWLSAHVDGFTDHILVAADVSNPAKPEVVGRWWLPGMWKAGGETPSWTGKRYALHHMIVVGDVACAAWRDGGFTLLDVKDPANIRLIKHVVTSPPLPGGTHTTLPLPGRGLLAVLDEANGFGCAKGHFPTKLWDIRDPANPSEISTLPEPTERDWCRPAEKFGPHNLWENRPDGFVSEDLLFATWLNAGLRVFDIRDATAPKEIASYVPPTPQRILDPRPGQSLSPVTCDVNVTKSGTVFMTDWNAGLHVLAWEG